jgi:hypothetical protein
MTEEVSTDAQLKNEPVPLDLFWVGHEYYVRYHIESFGENRFICSLYSGPDVECNIVTTLSKLRCIACSFTHGDVALL